MFGVTIGCLRVYWFKLFRWSFGVLDCVCLLAFVGDVCFMAVGFITWSEIYKNGQLKFLSLGVLVGAFSVFDMLDTGKPVQILGDFGIFTLFLESEGLI